MAGYRGQPPHPNWPDGAHIAVQFVLNYEEGGENCLLHGDTHSEAFLSEIVGAQPWINQRHWNMESIYEYGARAGFWRLHDLFVDADIPLTIYGVATALARNPDQVLAMQKAGWEIASHGYKWIEYKDFSAEDESAHIEAAIALHYQVTGEVPRGWYTGRCSVNTVSLVSQTGGFEYISDSYADDLPYWHVEAGKPQLIIPYTLDTNDMRFAAPQGFNSGDQFYSYLKDSFDALYSEGMAGSPKMLSVGLHCRLVGRPGRIQALRRFVDYVKSHEKVWLARRLDIARHWQQTHPFDSSAHTNRPSAMNREEFIAEFGDIFEDSAWVAEDAFALELGPAHDSAEGVHNALCRAFRAASYEKRLAVLCAHPDLAGKLAQQGELTQSSTQEQASAGLDNLSAQEVSHFTKMNSAYTEKFGHPFIIAVKGLNKQEILQAFQARIENNPDAEFTEACRQVEKIAILRLRDKL
jgi:OHCU decarboxylase